MSGGGPIYRLSLLETRDGRWFLALYDGNNRDRAALSRPYEGRRQAESAIRSSELERLLDEAFHDGMLSRNARVCPPDVKDGSSFTKKAGGPYIRGLGRSQQLASRISREYLEQIEPNAEQTRIYVESLEDGAKWRVVLRSTRDVKNPYYSKNTYESRKELMQDLESSGSTVIAEIVDDAMRDGYLRSYDRIGPSTMPEGYEFQNARMFTFGDLQRDVLQIARTHVVHNNAA